MPKISIVMPIYGVEKYLCQCVDSILAQTLKDIEIILVDDGSKDKCPEIVDEYEKKDSRITVIHKENSGYGHSINIGIEKAQAEYIGIIDSDDWIETDMFETLYQHAVKSGADFVKSDFFKYQGLKNKNQKADIIPSDIANSTIKPTNNLLAMNIGPSIWTGLYKKEFLIKNNIRLLETPGASYQDTGFHFKTLLASEKTYFTDKPLYHYRTDNAGSSVKDTKKIFCVCDEWQNIFKWAEKQGIFNSVSGLLCALRFNTYMWNFKRLSGKIQRQFLKRFSEEFKELYNQGLIKKDCFKKKTYKRLMSIMFHPIGFLFLYKLKHLPNKILKKIRG